MNTSTSVAGSFGHARGRSSSARQTNPASRLGRLLLALVAGAVAFSGLGLVSAPAVHAADEGIYGLTTTNASSNVSPIGGVNSFQAVIKPANTTTQFQVSFDTGSVSYSLNGSSGSLTSGSPSAPLAIPIGQSDLVLTFTASTSVQTEFHVYLKRAILVTDMWFEGTTSSSPTNFDSSTTVTVPLTPAFDANRTWTDDNGRPTYSVNVPHGVVKGRLVWTYSRAGEQGVTGYSVSYDGLRDTDLVYDAVSQTGTAKSGWAGLGVGATRFVVTSGTLIASGDINLAYTTNVTRGAALDSGAVSALALHDSAAIKVRC